MGAWRGIKRGTGGRNALQAGEMVYKRYGEGAGTLYNTGGGGWIVVTAIRLY